MQVVHFKGSRKRLMLESWNFFSSSADISNMLCLILMSGRTKYDFWDNVRVMRVVYLLWFPWKELKGVLLFCLVGCQLHEFACHFSCWQSRKVSTILNKKFNYVSYFVTIFRPGFEVVIVVNGQKGLVILFIPQGKKVKMKQNNTLHYWVG